MSSKYAKVIVPVGILAAATVVASLIAFSKPEPKAVVEESPPLLVNAIKAVKEDIRVSVRAQGTVTPRTSTTLIAEVSGRIVEVADSFKVGGYFQKGDPLLHIDKRDYRANLKRAEAAVASARSQLATEKGAAEVAYQDWKKYRSSVERSEAATALALRKPQLEEAQAQLDSALADLEQARDQLERTVIRAPYDGLFKAKQVDIGQYVNVGATLAEIFAVDVAELRLALPQHKLDYLELPTIADGDLKLEPPVALYAEIGDQLHQWSGRIVRTEGVFDERSRVLFAVAAIEDPYAIDSPRGKPLRIGTFVDAEIEGRVINDLVTLPRSMLRAGNRVWIIDEQNRLQNRKVNVLRTDGPQIYVTNGLEEGERVSASSIVGAIPGTRVRVSELTPSDQLENNTAPELQRPQPAPESEIDVAPAPPPGANSPESNNQDQAA